MYRFAYSCQSIGWPRRHRSKQHDAGKLLNSLRYLHKVHEMFYVKPSLYESNRFNDQEGNLICRKYTRKTFISLKTNISRSYSHCHSTCCLYRPTCFEVNKKCTSSSFLANFVRLNFARTQNACCRAVIQHAGFSQKIL